MDLILSMFQDMNATRWVILGVSLLVIELVTGTTYILWPAASALLVGILLFLGLPLGWSLQFLLFFVISTILLFVGHKYIRPKMEGGEPSDLNDRARSMVGMRVRAIGDFETGQGRVQVGDSQWRASMVKGDAKSGDELSVVSVKGTTLSVEPYGA